MKVFCYYCPTVLLFVFLKIHIKRSFSRFGVKLRNEIQCNLRNLPNKEFKREIRRLRLDILVKENDYII